MLSENKIPFLHVVSSNERAIKLYERLGFVKRRSISFWKIQVGNQE
jgi:predicted GNAT family acetyltransferase